MRLSWNREEESVRKALQHGRTSLLKEDHQRSKDLHLTTFLPERYSEEYRLRLQSSWSALCAASLSKLTDGDGNGYHSQVAKMTKRGTAMNKVDALYQHPGRSSMWSYRFREVKSSSYEARTVSNRGRWQAVSVVFHAVTDKRQSGWRKEIATCARLQSVSWDTQE
jgi:hypothetical protein